MRTLSPSASIAALALALVFPAQLSAQRRGGNAEHAAAVERLASTSPSEVRSGLEALGLAGSPRAVAPISERIRRGLPPDLLGVAVDTLMILGRAEAGPVLVELMSHRRAEIRLKALQAIVACRPRGAEAVLAEALSDSDASVRGAAAEGLGSIGASGSVDALFHAMERRVPEAPMAIAQVARPADVERFLGMIGDVPFDTVSPALSEMIHRQDLADGAKLAIIHRLSELATSGVREFLEDIVAGASEDVGPRVMQAAREAIPRIGQ